MKFATGQKTIFPRRVISSIALPQLRSFGDAWLPGQVPATFQKGGGPYWQPCTSMNKPDSHWGIARKILKILCGIGFTLYENNIQQISSVVSVGLEDERLD